MKVILTDRVRALGNVGELVNVSPGYARNFLLPRDLAVVADEKNTKVIEAQQRRLNKKIEEQKQLAVDLQKKVEGIELTVTKRVGGTGKLFGTVTTNEISTLLEKEGIDVERRLLSLPLPIKSLGTYDVDAKLFSGVSATFKINVLIDEKQRQYITFDAFFANTMFHEVAHGLGIKNTINDKGTVRTALKEGDDVNVKIFTVDKKNRTVSLSIKAQEEHTEAELTREYAKKSSDAAPNTTLGDLLKGQMDADDKNDA